MGLGLPAATVAASEVPEAVQIVQDVFMRPVFRVYRSDDIRGVEYGGALKNIVALACGVQDGIGLGDNCRAALMTRGLVEMARFGVHFGARRETFSAYREWATLLLHVPVPTAAITGRALCWEKERPQKKSAKEPTWWWKECERLSW